MIEWIRPYLLRIYLWFRPLIREAGKLNRRLSGIRKDKDDDRDFKFLATGKELPRFHALSINPYDYVKNQGKWNSCMSHAVASGLEALHDIRKTKYKTIPLSERYHYYYARVRGGKLPQNVGMTMRDGLKTAYYNGLSPEKLCPYISSKMNVRPDTFAQGFTNWFKVRSYYRLNSIEDVKEAVYNGLPVIIGVRLNSSFMSYSGAITVKDGEKLYGGHGVLVYGYGDMTQELLCINSWGSRYKDDGTMRVPYLYWEKYELDTWTFTI